MEYLEPIIEYCNANGINLEMAIGIKNIEVYKRIMDMGAKRFILKFETSNKDVFEDVKDCHCSFDDYIAFIKLLKKNGAHIGSGNIIGLPGTTIRDIANDIKLINDLDLNMISTSIFIPNKESVFANEKTGDRELALRYISIMTLLQRDRRISIPTNSSFGLNNKIKALKLGANVLSVNYTNTDYEKKYSIYDGAARYRADLDKTKNYIKQAGMDCISWREFKKNEPK